MSVSLSSSDLEAIRQLLKIVTSHRLAELTISLREGVSVTIRAETKTEPAHGMVYQPYSHGGHAQQMIAAPLAGTPLAGKRPEHRGAPIVSPMVGIFYHASSPGDPPFVNVGDVIQVGQTIGLIEAMKVFSEIPSEVAGRVAEILVENGELLQLGQDLMYVEQAS